MLLNCHPVHSCIRERRRPPGLNQGAERQPVTLQRGTHVGHAIGVRRPTPTEIGQQGQDSIETNLTSKLSLLKHLSTFMGPLLDSQATTLKPKLKGLSSVQAVIFKFC